MSGLLDGAKKAFRIVKGRATPAQTTQPAPIQTMRVHTEKVLAIAFFKDGRRIVTPSKDRTLRIWDLESIASVGGLFEGHSDRVYSVAVSPDDRQFASGGETGAIIIWDVDRKQMLFKRKKHKGLVSSVCFSPDGKRLASGSLDKKVILWDAKSGAVLSTLQSAGGSVCCVTFSPNGLQLASGSYRTVQVWSTDSENVAELLFNINFAHQCWVKSVVWTPNGKQLVSASQDQTIKFWDSSNGTKIGQPCTGHTHEINSLAISSDASFIASASFDKTVRLWSTESYKQIGRRLKHTTRVSSVVISPNGELLVIGDYDGNLQLWSIENILAATPETDSSYYLYLAHRSKVKLGQNLYAEALLDAEKVIELNPRSHLGDELKHAALGGAQLHQQYASPEHAIRRATDAKLENAPLRLINTITGHIYDRSAQINAFTKSTEYKGLLHSLVMHAPLQTELIQEAVATYFSWVMLSHRWEAKEPLLHDIQGNIYNLDPVGTNVKLQKFCKVARNAGHQWAWVDTCCIDQNNNIELQQSVNSMFIWYHYSALTIVYLSDVLPSSESRTLASSIWNTRGWTVQEFLAPIIVLFYQVDWTLYLDDHSRNHKESVSIMRELEDSTGINARTLIDFHPGKENPREKLQWASNRKTTKEEDIAYSLFGIFGVHLPVIYGEKRQNALGRLLQVIIAHSGDITALDWVGQPSNFNSCLPAHISSYKAPSFTLPSLSEDEMQNSVSTLRNTVAVESASNLYTLLEKLGIPRFADGRLQLPCIAFPLTEVRQRPGQYGDQCFIYDVKADGLQDLLIITKDQLVQFWPGKPLQRTVLLIRPWTCHLLELSDFAELPDFPEPPDNDDESSVEDYWSVPESPLHDSPPESPGEQGPVHPECERAFRLAVHLGRPFSAFLLAEQRVGEYKRIASDNNIIAQVRDATSVDDMIDVRTLEIL